MTNRRLRSVVTREGWYYLFILGFVVLGSFLRNIPLLVGLSAILATAMLINWRWSRALMRGLRFERLPTEAIWAGQPVKFGFLIENTRARLSAFSLLITQRFAVVQVAGGEPTAPGLWRRWADWLLGNRQQHYSLVAAVHPGGNQAVEQSVLFHRRGEYRIGPVTLSTHFPLGLVRREWRDETERPVLVGPAVGRLSQNWIEQMLGLGWRDSQAGQIARSGDEFFNLRPFSTGDSQRWIHWRASARHNRLLVRQFQHSQSKAFSLVVDCWGGARGDLALTAFSGDGTAMDGRQADEVTERLLSILATVSEAVRVGQLDNVTLTLVADTVESIQFPCSEPAWLAWQRRLALAAPHHEPRRLADALQRLVVGGAASSAEGEVPAAMARSNRSEAPVVVLSPLSIDQYARMVARRPAANRGAEGDSAGAANGAPSGGDFWQVQSKIRTWLTPGDAWLSSWYLEPQAEDLWATADEPRLVGREIVAAGLPAANGGIGPGGRLDAQRASSGSANGSAAGVGSVSAVGSPRQEVV